MKKWVRNIIIILVIIFALLIGFAIFSNSAKKQQSSTKRFITSNPLDLSQIEQISRFRSCVGHDYSTNNVDGEKETLRSMKHYIDFDNSYRPDAVQITAPFDGEITQLDTNNNPGQLVYLSPDADPGWNFIFFHVQLLPSLGEGTRIITGQHLGNVHPDVQVNFDIAMRRFGFGGQATDSMFHHMNANVLAEYASAGVTVENVIATKKERDSAPCPLDLNIEAGPRDTFFVSGGLADDWVILQ